MSTSNADSDRDRGQAREQRSVLSELPHTRPQRASRRREASRASRAGGAGGDAAGADSGAAGADVGASGAQSDATAPTASQKRRPARKSGSSSSPLSTDPPQPAQPAGLLKSGRPGRREGALEEPPAPPQGFEPDEDLAVGTSVEPPSAIEVAGSIVGLAGELAHAGLSATGRLLRSALSRASGG